MKRFLLLFLLILAPTVSAVAEPGQQPAQPQQARKNDYWLSQDMQRLVFWQVREPEVQTGRSSSSR